MDSKMPSPIFITGAARSGTSMIAGAIHICGAWKGTTAGATIHNKRGMFENSEIRNQIMKPYLRSIGMDPMGQYPLPDIAKISIPVDWRVRVENIMSEQGYKSGPWMFKGAKMCLMWPIWHYAFPNAKWIIVRRRSGDIATSCCKTGFMRAFRNEAIQKSVGVKNERDGWLWWINQHLERFREMINEGLNCKVVWPERMVGGDYQQVMETIEWLGLKWNSDVLSFIDPKLWKARRK